MGRLKKYRSKFEAKLAALPAFKGATYEGRVFEYEVPTTHRYTPDFMLANGIFIEAKGFFRPTDRLKMLLVKQQYPYIDLRIVLQTPYKTLSKYSMTTYAAWCEKHGFLWCAGNDAKTLNAWRKDG